LNIALLTPLLNMTGMRFGIRIGMPNSLCIERMAEAHISHPPE